MPGTAPPLRLLLVDDEPLARARLRALLAEGHEPAVEVVGEAGTAAQALAWLLAHPDPDACDALLLDVHMPGQQGVALAAELRRRGVAGGAAGPGVVFVTAHAEHAVAAFEVEALDYLTKPVRRERLAAALRRVAQRRAALRPAAALVPADTPAPGASPAPSSELPTAVDGLPPVRMLVVTERGRVVRVPVDDVLYLKAELKYVTLRTAERSWLLDDSLTDLEARLGERFLRIHRNAIVARPAVRALELETLSGDANDPQEAWVVKLAGIDERLVVSRRQLAAVREALGREA
ncbi:MAG: LytTR family DNA-binding domain-containing protein [Ideonella sp.]|jgi:two-component system response regulator AlgR|nr:LytTR family DNA-binding domain-containing protein [Ideonella sp.]